MKIKNIELDQEAIKSINELINQEINALSAFKLVKLVKQLDDIIKIKTQSEVNLIKKYSKKDENGEIILGKDEEGNQIDNTYEIENVEEFNKEMEELMLFENDVDYEMIPFEDLGLKTTKVKNLLKLEFLFSL